MRIGIARRTLVQVLAATCLIFVSIDQVTSSQLLKRSRRDISFSKLEKAFVLEPGKPLTVIANRIGTAGVVCVQRSGNLEGVRLKACVVIYKDNQNAKFQLPRIEQVVPLPEGTVTLSGNTLTIDGHATLHRRVVIHLGVPLNTEVTVSANGQKVADGITSNMVVQNGKILSAPADYSFQAAVMQAISLKLQEE